MNSIAYVTEGDVSRWEQALAADYEQLDSAVKAGKTQNGRRIFLLFRENLNWAGAANARGDQAQVAARLIAASNYYLLLLREVAAGTADVRYINESIDDAISVALILDESLMFEQLRARLTAQVDEPVTLYGEAAFAIMHGEFEEALQLSQRLVQVGSQRFGLGLPRALAAVAARDASGFRNALQQAVAEFDRYAAGEARGTPEAALFLRGSALLALHNGVHTVRINAAEIDPRLVAL